MNEELKQMGTNGRCPVVSNFDINLEAFDIESQKPSVPSAVTVSLKDWARGRITDPTGEIIQVF
jgi:hypothetical protein